jgi:hypothetical protein
MSVSYERIFQRCAECGAQCGPTADRCWMCDAPLSRGKNPPGASLEVTAAAVERPPSDLEAARTSASTRRSAMLLLIVALAVIGGGLSLQGAGLAILYLVVVIPALIAMSISLARKKPDQWTQGASLGETLLLLFAKFLNTVGVLFLVVFGVVIAVGVFCFLLLASNAIRL